MGPIWDVHKNLDSFEKHPIFSKIRKYFFLKMSFGFFWVYLTHKPSMVKSTHPNFKIRVSDFVKACVTVLCKEPFFLRLFKKFLWFSLHIFKSTCRITLIFLLEDSPKSGECFRYPQHTFWMCFWVSTSSESQKFASKLRNFYNSPTYFSKIFKAFFKHVLIFLAYFQKYASYHFDFSTRR